MYISYNWLKEIVDFDMDPEKLDQVLTMLGIEVESKEDFSKKYDNFFTAKVLSKEKHPNADKLSLCKVSIGKEEKQVVCGAPNVAAGQTVVLGVLGAVVPQNGTALKKVSIRGIESFGMICSKFELNLSEDHSGIWVLPEDAPVGMPLAEYLNMNDTIFEISITPNRSDCLSHYGIAREIAAYNNNKIKEAEINVNETDAKASESVEIIVEDKEKCPRYSARVLKNAKVCESPEWLKARLTKLGFRPVNAVVDVTNYVLIECGQPLHAFDLNKIEGRKILVKTLGKTEKFITLDDKERTLTEDMLMICDGNKPLAIAGVMGGQNSEITDDSCDILIESAYFQPASVRKTAKALGIQSEASYRFERGTDYNRTTWAADRAAQLIAEITGAQIEKGMIDIYPEPIVKQPIKLRFAKANGIMGVNLSADEQIKSLEALNCKVISRNDKFAEIDAPSYRVDLESEIDLIEELAIMYDYDNIQGDSISNLDFNTASFSDTLKVPQLKAESNNYFIQNGFNELLTQNMIDPASAKLFTENLVEIANPLGEELSIMRPSIIPSILKTIERNIRFGNTDLRFFEIGKVFNVQKPGDKVFVEGFKESYELICALTGNARPLNWSEKAAAVDFYSIKGIAESYFENFKFKNIKYVPKAEEHPVFSKNTCKIMYKNIELGFVGEVSKKALKFFGIEAPVYLLVVDFSRLLTVKRKSEKYSSISPYPAVSRDLAFVVDKNIAAEELRQEIQKNGGQYLKEVQIFDVFEGDKLGNGKKSLAFSLKFSSDIKTLIDEEIDLAVNSVIGAAETKFNAVLREF